MPSHSRSRDRRRGGPDREQQEEPGYTTRRRYGDDIDDDDNDFNPSLNERRYRRESYYDYDQNQNHNRDHDDDYDSPRGNNSQSHSRGYGYRPQHDYYYYEGGDLGRRLQTVDDEDDNNKRRSRPRSKAKESPATSPVKKSHRKRDREGQRHHHGGPSPTKGVRERRHHREGHDRERYRGPMDDETRRQRRRERARERERERVREEAALLNRKHQSHDSTNSASHLLGANRLSSQYQGDEDKGFGLETSHETEGEEGTRAKRRRRRQQKQAALLGDYYDDDEKARVLDEFPGDTDTPPKTTSRGRVVSGSFLEKGPRPDMRIRHSGGGGGGGGGSGMGRRWNKEGDWDGGPDGTNGDQGPFWKRKKWKWIIGIGIVAVLLAIIIPVAVVVSKKHNNAHDPDDNPGKSQSSGSPYTSNLDGLDPDSIPESARGTILDPWTWYDTIDFNLTYTDETVGGLPIMGLNSTWDDSARPNEHVPPLNETFPYGLQPIRGVNLGGWLSIEPFIVPSLFQDYSSSQGIIDEWTLTKQLGKSAASTIEKHYAQFIREEDFKGIRDAGLDHVRIQYSYWAVTTYDGDPYVPKIAWRYLLRAIEYCRKYGLRVNLDLHGIPGSQNGWNHSGHQGTINWLNGTDGELNRQRSLEIHDQLSKFFAQDRYKNIITIYGLVNEPLMLALPVEPVLNWTREAAKLVQKNGISALITFHDGFLPLSKWDAMLKDAPPNMMLDTHQYTIFNTGEIVLNHTAKIELMCNAWYPMIQQINSTSTGWGPTMCGEWSQADTDCTKYLNNVGRGTRWEGTFTNTVPYCPTAKSGPRCSCTNANADPATYSPDYKKWLRMYAEAQMSVFETAQGWFYWTWHTESAAQWSYKTAWMNGYMPPKAYERDFRCGDAVPDFGGIPEFY